MSNECKRPSWDDYFMNIAHNVAQRSTCIRRHVGAILVKDKRIIATGYNGVPSALKHCSEIGCMRKNLGIPSGKQHELCRAVHAEQNAIIQAARYGVTTQGSTLYCTTQPCSLCAKMMINAGVVEIIYEGGYPDELSSKLLDEANIKVRRMKRD